MSYMALYRKWRPVSFEDVKGQDPVVQTLKNSDYFRSDRSCLSVLRNQRYGKNQYCKNLCQSSKL